ncbi:MAG: cobaltochelatase subunit CobT [Gammaproteobacteria bacterium]
MGQQQNDQFRRATEATLRALAERNDIDVEFGAANHANISGTTARFPTPPKGLPYAAVQQVRGEADQMALKLKYHNSNLHQRCVPADPAARAAFEALERTRYQAIGAERLSGVADNLTALLSSRCRDQGFDSVHERNPLQLPEALALLAREAMLGTPPPPAASKLMQLWRPELEEKLGENISALQASMHDQQAYAKTCQNLLEDLGFVSEPASEQSDDQNPLDSDDDDQPGDSGDSEADDAATSAADSMAGESSEEADADGEAMEQESIDMDSGAADTREGEWSYNMDGSNLPATERYRAFTTQYDEIVQAEELASAEELSRLRKQLDQHEAHLQGVIGKLANRLQRRLMARQTREWLFDLEEGMLDAARLARVVANPNHSLSYKQEKDTDFRDTVVTLLIDNSGSMRGRPIIMAAVSTDILARILERCGVRVEILGFTTRAWKGGQSREKWLAQEKPANPGRLNDLRHIIYKSADTPWRRARNNLGMMFSEGILKENIDGEALLWAHSRLIARPEQRRILMVISDGAPVDDSTLSVNPSHYLDQHLRQVIDYIENRSPVELLAIGIGHDVTRYYRRAVTLVDAEQLGGTIMEELADLFAQESAHLPAARRRQAGVARR